MAELELALQVSRSHHLRTTAPHPPGFTSLEQPCLLQEALESGGPERKNDNWEDEMKEKLDQARALILTHR